MPQDEIKYTTAKTSMLPGVGAKDSYKQIRNPKKKSTQIQG